MQAIRVNLQGRARLVAVGAILAAALFVLAPGGRSSASAQGSATASRSVTVGIDHFEYMPHTLRVAKGTTVVFANESKSKHTATRKGSFTTGKILPGKSVSVRFTAPGTYAYHCTIHPEMHGKIVVG